MGTLLGRGALLLRALPPPQRRGASVVAKLLVTGLAGRLDLIQRRGQRLGRQRLLGGGGKQAGGAHFRLTGQFIEALLVLPDLVLVAALAFVAHLGEVLPRCLDQAVEL